MHSKRPVVIVQVPWKRPKQLLQSSLQPYHLERLKTAAEPTTTIQYMELATSVGLKEEALRDYFEQRKKTSSLGATSTLTPGKILNVSESAMASALLAMENEEE